MQFDNVLINESFDGHSGGEYDNFDQLPGMAFVGAHVVDWSPSVHPAIPDNIEHIYSELHKWVDEAVAKVSVHKPPQLERILEQNRRLIDKLTTLESTITGGETAVDVGTEIRMSPATVIPSNVSRARSGVTKRRASQARPGYRNRSVSSVSIF